MALVTSATLLLHGQSRRHVVYDARQLLSASTMTFCPPIGSKRTLLADLEQYMRDFVRNLTLFINHGIKFLYQAYSAPFCKQRSFYSDLPRNSAINAGCINDKGTTHSLLQSRARCYLSRVLVWGERDAFDWAATRTPSPSAAPLFSLVVAGLAVADASSPLLNSSQLSLSMPLSFPRPGSWPPFVDTAQRP